MDTFINVYTIQMGMGDNLVSYIKCFILKKYLSYGMLWKNRTFCDKS